MRTIQWLCLIVIASSVCAGCDDPSTDGDGDADLNDSGPLCRGDDDCDDDQFCDGIERCDPSDEGADDEGCLEALDGACSGAEVCLEAEDRCVDEGNCSLPDGDGDGHDRGACGGDDCDDIDPRRFPGNVEICDPDDRDEDCDPTTFGFRDQDGDGSVDAQCCNEDELGDRACGDDCDDLRVVTHPNNTEVCDGFDNDCDGEVDEGVLETFWIDADRDGHGSGADDALFELACAQPHGYASSKDDCDDSELAVHPGAPEVCDSVDNNCDGVTDPGCDCADGERVPCGVDTGECEPGTQLCIGGRFGTCGGGVGPRPEVCNGVDDDCDGEIDDGVMNTYFDDRDGDGYGDPWSATVACAPTGGQATSSTDCDDSAAAVHPGASEVCDGIDNDCDGATDPECLCSDGTTVPCGTDVGECERGTQLCVGGSYEACRGGHPASPEICNGLDDDCDGLVDEEVTATFFFDSDGDGFGDPLRSVTACSAPDGSVTDGTDCDDRSPSVHPGAAEICDRLDTDCSDGGGVAAEEDLDDDGHAPEGSTVCTGGPLPRDDCNDEASEVHPGQYLYFHDRTCPPSSSWCESLGCCGRDVTAYPRCTRPDDQCIDEPSPYDYNCDGLDEPMPAFEGCFAMACTPGGPVYSGAPPACGESVTWIECVFTGASCMEQPPTDRPMPCH